VIRFVSSKSKQYSSMTEAEIIDGRVVTRKGNKCVFAHECGYPCVVKIQPWPLDSPYTCGCWEEGVTKPAVRTIGDYMKC